MIVTTSTFSTKARQAAEASGIRLIDGVEFTRLAKLAPPRGNDA
jgi:restriction endonuclease Mrr